MEYSLKELSECFNRPPSNIGKILKNHNFPFEFKNGKTKYFFQDAFNYLGKLYFSSVEVIEVPKYIPVYYEIIPSKMNFEN